MEATPSIEAFSTFISWQGNQIIPRNADRGNYKEDLTWFLFTVKVKITPQFFLVGPNLRVVPSREILARAWKSSPARNVTRGGQFSRVHACFPRSITPV